MNYFFLTNTPLFHGIQENEIELMLRCFNPVEKSYQKNEVIFRAGTAVHEIGMVEEGSVNIVVNFYWGSSRIFGHVKKGEIFAENYAAMKGRELLCDVVAAEPCQILFIDLDRLLATCQKACSFHQRLIHNLLFISAKKNLSLSSRMMHTAPKTIRERILSYLSEQAMMAGSLHFVIPYNRQQMADYLGVDRSALSAELSRMRKEGLITYKKNEFTLNDHNSQK